MNTKLCTIGVDLGGTNVRSRAYFKDGQVASPRYQDLSKAKEGQENIIKALVEIIKKTIEAAEVKPKAIGIAIPGHIDDEKGIIYWAPNFGIEIHGVFHDWQNVPIKALLKEHFDIPIFIGNDANLAALGEYVYGSGKNSAKCLVMLTVGSGIGTGIILSPHAVYGNAKGPLILLGGNKGGTEIGHMCINMNGPETRAGLYGTLESYCQKDNIINRVIHKLKQNRYSIINDLVQGNLDLINPEILSKAANENDEVAIETWEEIGTFLGYGIGNCINIFAPEILAIGGQISKAGKWLIHPAIKQARKVAIPTLLSSVKIIQAERFEDAGLLGGANYAMQAINNSHD